MGAYYAHGLVPKNTWSQEYLVPRIQLWTNQKLENAVNNQLIHAVSILILATAGTTGISTILEFKVQDRNLTVYSVQSY